MRILRSVAALLLLVGALAACTNASSTGAASSPSPSDTRTVDPSPPSVTETNIPTQWPIKHVVVIMQENRSFDTYFGTYPGADGIPMQNGVPTVCSPDPQTQQCIKPYHNSEDVNSGGPHASTSATADINGGKMDGWLLTPDTNKTDGDLFPIGYYTDADLPFFAGCASNWTSCSRLTMRRTACWISQRWPNQEPPSTNPSPRSPAPRSAPTSCCSRSAKAAC